MIPKKMRRSSKAFFLFVLLGTSLPLAQASFFSQTTIEEIQARLKRFPEQGRYKAKAALCTELGLRFYRQGHYAESIDAFETALLNKTNKSMRRQIYVYMGKSYEAMSRLDKAIQAYEHAVEEDPKDWRWHRDLGHLYSTTQLYRKAIKSFETALKRNRKEEASIHFELGHAWRLLGLYENSEPHLKRALEKGHDRVQVQRDLSYLYEGQGKFETAKQAWTAVVDSNASPEDQGRLIYLAVLAGDKPTAASALKQLKTKNASKDTVQFYENLVSSQAASPEQLLTLRFANMPMRVLIGSYFHEDIGK